MPDARPASATAPVAEEEPTPEERAPIDDLLDVVDAPVPRRQPEGMRSATLVAVDRMVQVRFRGRSEPVAAALAPGVDHALLRHALETGDAVLVECEPDAPPVIVGVLMTKLPRKLELKAEEIHIDAERELVLRSGRAALRMRQDGNVELVGTRISAASRGLFKLVGRMLRLN